MILYMLRDKTSGLWYKRGPAYADIWVSQEEASIWPTPKGPQACKGRITIRNRRNGYLAGYIIRDPEVVEIPITCNKTITIVERHADWVEVYFDQQFLISFCQVKDSKEALLKMYRALGFNVEYKVEHVAR